MNPDDLAFERDLFRGFHWGLDPDGVELVDPSPEPERLVKLGDLEAVTYRTRKGGVGDALWEHCFGEEGDQKPVLAMDPRNQRLHIVGGGYGVEDRGIVR